LEYGARFDKEESGEYSLGREGGHSVHRILHHKDVTGKEMERALLHELKQRKNIELIDHCFVIDLATQHHLGYLVTKSTPDITCFGVYVLNLRSNKIEKILSKITLLATGGCGQAYRTTTNPKIATGDGIAMVYAQREGSRIWSSSSFIQRLYFSPANRLHSLSQEAVRGDGGILRKQRWRGFYGTVRRTQRPLPARHCCPRHRQRNETHRY